MVTDVHLLGVFCATAMQQTLGAGTDLTQNVLDPGLRAVCLHCSLLQLFSFLAFPPSAAPASNSPPAASAFAAAPRIVRVVQHS